MASIDKLTCVAELRAKLLKLGIRVPDVHDAEIRIGVYGDSAGLSHELLELIRHGHKRAGTSLLWDLGARGEQVGQVGTVEIVVDHRGEPSVVTRDLSVTVMAFAEVGAEYAALEAEGDLSLRYWRTAHWTYFST